MEGSDWPGLSHGNILGSRKGLTLLDPYRLRVGKVGTVRNFRVLFLEEEKMI